MKPTQLVAEVRLSAGARLSQRYTLTRLRDGSFRSRLEEANPESGKLEVIEEDIFGRPGDPRKIACAQLDDLLAPVFAEAAAK